MSRFLGIFNPEYLLAVPTLSKYEAYYLYLSIFILVVSLSLKLFFKIKKRSEAFRDFDRFWFWGYLAIGLSGLFIWFSRSQQLPTFGTRLISYLWLGVVLVYALFLLFYYLKFVTKAIESYHEKKRKERYLR